VRVAALQTGLAGHDTRALAGALDRCAELSVDLLVLPECYFGGMPRSAAEADGIAVSAPYSPLLDLLRECASTITVVIGFVERSAHGGVHSSAAAIKADVVLGVTRKRHPIESIFTSGVESPTYPLGDHSFGVVICYDANFVEPARRLAVAGARVLVCPLNNGLPHDVAARWVTRTHANLVSRAVENECWVVAADVCGAASGRVGIGATRIVAPDGRVVAAASSDMRTLLVAEMDIA
jgi:predicted amidohydrolase